MPKPPEITKPAVLDLPFEPAPNFARQRLLQKEKNKPKEAEVEVPVTSSVPVSLPSLSLPAPLRNLFALDHLKNIVQNAQSVLSKRDATSQNVEISKKEEVDELEEAMNDRGGIPQTVKDDMNKELEDWAIQSELDDEERKKEKKEEEIAETKKSEKLKSPENKFKDTDIRKIDLSSQVPVSSIWPAGPFGDLECEEEVKKPSSPVPSLSPPPAPESKTFNDKSFDGKGAQLYIHEPFIRPQIHPQKQPSTIDPSEPEVSIPGLGGIEELPDYESNENETEEINNSVEKKQEDSASTVENSSKKQLSAMTGEELAALAAKQLEDMEPPSTVANTQAEVEDEGIITDDSTDDKQKIGSSKRSRSSTPVGHSKKRQRRSHSKDRPRDRPRRSHSK